MAFRILDLRSPAGWQTLSAALMDNQTNLVVSGNLIKQLRSLSVQAALVEEDYIDKDFSEAFTAYYATTFRRHSKYCIRVLFFRCDISFLDTETDVKVAAEKLQRSAPDFVGQIVLRPVSKAPLHQATIALPPPPPGYEGHLLVKARYTAHALGAEFSVDAAPMTQQDSRVGACAQASIWVAARHFHTKHRGPWLSTVAITKAAIANSEYNINHSLPAGSEFLTANNMVAALRSAGREPLIYAAKITNASPKPTWGSLRPADIINRYVDSGIPVIVGLHTGQDIGHAAVLTGQILTDVPRNSPFPHQPTKAEYCEAFYANDDQQGPNLIVSVSSSSPINQVPYNIEDNAHYFIIPLPGKVYLPAEKAEAIAWDTVRQYCADWPSLKINSGQQLGSSSGLGDVFVGDMAQNKIFARTYLTYGWRYKQRAIMNRFPNPVRQLVRSLDLPRYVYVTEFASIDDTTRRVVTDRRIFAHCVIDATAKHQDIESVLFMNAPGLCFWHFFEPTSQKVKQGAAVVQNSTRYFPKVRGGGDFSSFYQSSYP